MSQWVYVADDGERTDALEVTGLGVIVRSTRSAGIGMCFVPGARVKDGQILVEQRPQPLLGGPRAPVKILDEATDY